MKSKKVYKINEHQLKLITDNQKTTPQLQTEIFDSLANSFGKLLTWGFKQSVSAFKFLSGIGVNVYYKTGDTFNPRGAVPIKKNNPLAPLSLYNPNLSALPENWQNLFVGLNKAIKTLPPKGQEQDQSKEQIQTMLSQVKFDDINDDKPIVYKIKFQFQNLKKEAKENSELMMITWHLKFEAKSNGKITENSSITFNLIEFSSEGINFGNIFGKEGGGFNQQFMKNVSQVSGKDFRLVFSNSREGNKFISTIQKQITDSLDKFIGQANADIGEKDLIKNPTIKVTIDPKLNPGQTPNVPNQTNQGQTDVADLDTDIAEITRQIEAYKDQDQYKAYSDQLDQLRKKLILKKEQVNNKK